MIFHLLVCAHELIALDLLIGTPPMSSSEDETGVKLIIIIIIMRTYNFYFGLFI